MIPLTIALVKGANKFSSLAQEVVEARYQSKIVQLEIPGEAIAPGMEEELTTLMQEHKGVVRVVLWGFRADEPIPRQLLIILGSRTVSSVERLEMDGAYVSLLDHRPWQECQSRTLIVFPGPVIPISMGSHQRVFQLAASLMANDCAVDLLITGSSDEAVELAKPLLYQICCQVFCYGNRKPRLKFRALWRRRIEGYLRRTRGEEASAPALFEERYQTAATFSGKRLLRRLAIDGKYRAVVVSYAWLANIRAFLAPEELSRTTWICDTHDVQFIRNATDNQKEWRFLRSAAKEKRKEIEVLASFDKVLAISEVDAGILRAELGNDKVLFTPTGFDYALDSPRTPDPTGPVFGFIGRQMRANEKALELILEDWWPMIRQRWPEAILHIAGDICRSPLLSSDKINSCGIIKDGFVPSLAGWYRKIDIMANPVAVQGGINFKSLEAIMAGRLLLTNTMGLGCLGNPKFAAVADDGATAVERVESELSNLQQYVVAREQIRDEARQCFGDERAIHGLLCYLREVLKVQKHPNPPLRSQVVLIQCGDHLENRTRILPLAMGLRERGHHPVVLVYSPEHVLSFVAQGVDAVSLYSFSRPRRKRFRLTKTVASLLGEPYLGFNLDDVSYVAQRQKPSAYNHRNGAKTIRLLKRQIDRTTKMLDHVKPDQIIVWNGYTGYVANILRVYARNRNIVTYFLERSIFTDSVFVDPVGTNGSSELCALNLEAIKALPVRRPVRGSNAFTAPADSSEVQVLKEAGPWRTARRIIFVPLQVETDTNIVLYSPDCKTMSDFVRKVHHSFHGPGVAIIVRPHPEEVARAIDPSDIQKTVTLEKRENLPSGYDAESLPDTYVNSSGNLETWLELADLVVTINSTVGMQALLKGTPVRALGRGIFTGKDLCGEVPPSMDSVGSFWDVLIDHYTNSSSSRLAGCLERRFPNIAPIPDFAWKNPTRLDPDERHAEITRTLQRICEEADRAGCLYVWTNLDETHYFDLDYRRFKVRYDPELLIERIRTGLSLARETKVYLVDDIADSSPSLLVPNEISNQIQLPVMDRYGWMVQP